MDECRFGIFVSVRRMKALESPPPKFSLIIEGSWSLVDAEGDLQTELSCTLAILWVGCN